VNTVTICNTPVCSLLWFVTLHDLSSLKEVLEQSLMKQMEEELFMLVNLFHCKSVNISLWKVVAEDTLYEFMVFNFLNLKNVK